MGLFQQIGVLLQKDVLLELRSKYAISGILLYVCSTLFIVNIAFQNVQRESWNTLFWIIVLFASVNAILKSFLQENSSRQLYYYTLVNPLAIIISKFIYNIGLLLVLSLLTWAAFSFFAGSPVENNWQFFLALFLGSAGFAITFTFISAISAKADHSATLIAILGFPLVIPILITLIKISANAIGILQDTGIGKDVMILVAIDLLLLSMAFVLYPFLWRD